MIRYTDNIEQTSNLISASRLHRPTSDMTPKRTIKRVVPVLKFDPTRYIKNLSSTMVLEARELRKSRNRVQCNITSVPMSPVQNSFPFTIGINTA